MNQFPEIVTLSYFSMNSNYIILAVVFLFIYAIVFMYLILVIVQDSNPDYCSPLMYFLLGGESCNKKVYNTAYNAIRKKNGQFYTKTQSILEDVETKLEKTEQIKRIIREGEMANQTLYNNMAMKTASDIESSKVEMEKVNEETVSMLDKLYLIYNTLKDMIPNITNQALLYIDDLRNKINIAYVTPALEKVIVPLTKLYNALVAKFVRKNQLSSYTLEDRKPENLYATLTETKRIFQMK